MLDKTTPLHFAGARFNRLFWPLLFGILVIVPPQSYYEIVSDLHYSDGYLAFFRKIPVALQRLVRPEWLPQCADLESPLVCYLAAGLLPYIRSHLADR